MLRIFLSPTAYTGVGMRGLEFFQVLEPIWGKLRIFTSPAAYMGGELGIFTSPRAYGVKFGIFPSPRAYMGGELGGGRAWNFSRSYMGESSGEEAWNFSKSQNLCGGELGIFQSRNMKEK